MLNRSYIHSHKNHPHYITTLKILSLQKKIKLSSDGKNLLMIIRNISDPAKLKIYLLLSKIKALPVTDIAKILGYSQSATSHSLSDLKKLGLVESYRCGQLVCYSLNKNRKKYKTLNFLKMFKNYETF